MVRLLKQPEVGVKCTGGLLANKSTLFAQCANVNSGRAAVWVPFSLCAIVSGDTVFAARHHEGETK